MGLLQVSCPCLRHTGTIWYNTIYGVIWCNVPLRLLHNWQPGMWASGWKVQYGETNWHLLILILSRILIYPTMNLRCPMQSFKLITVIPMSVSLKSLWQIFWLGDDFVISPFPVIHIHVLLIGITYPKLGCWGIDWDHIWKASNFAWNF